jgi:parallel beta-helix repeat protein
MNYYNCQFNNSYLGFPGIGNCICGGYLSASPIDGTFENCSFDGHTAVSAIQAFHRSGECFGVRSSRNTHLINCTANNLTNIGDQQLPAPVVGNNSIIGFIFLYAKDVTLDGCISQDLIKNGPSGATRSRGIEIQSSSGDPAAAVNNIVVRNCVVSRVFSFNGGISAGFVLRNQFATDATKSTVFENCISTGNQTFAPTLTTAGIVQGPAWGFFVQLLPTASPEAFSAIPTSFEGCKALHNKGVPVLVGATNQYTAGFYVNNALEVSFHNCEVVDNIYGFLLQRSGNCTIRNCRADSNFVAGTLSTEAIAVGGTGYTVGDILTLTGGSNNAQVRVTTIGAGGVVTGITLVNVGSGYTTGIVPTTGGTGTGATVNITAIATIGEGFTDVGPTPGTPAAPGLSTSTFERNQSFKNGAGNIHDGTNGNYNILYNAAGPVHEALLAGSLSVINSFAPTPSQPTYYAILHNLSVIQ